MYEASQKASGRVYAPHLTKEGVAGLTATRVTALEAELEAAKAARQRPDSPSMTAMWRGYRGGITDVPEEVDTRVARPLLEQIAQAMTEVPQGFTP